MKACLVLLLSVSAMISCKKDEPVSTTSADIISLGFLTDGQYTIRSAQSGLCLDIPTSSTTNGVQLQQWQCNGTNAQRFDIISVGGGYFRIINVNSRKALDVRDASQNNGAAIQQWDYYGTPQQLFRVDMRGLGRFSISSRLSSKVLDLAGTTNAAKLQQWSYTGGANQIWMLSRMGNASSPTTPAPKPTPAPTPPPAPTGGTTYLSGRGIAKYHIYEGVNKCSTAFGLNPPSFGMMVTAASTQIYDRFPAMLKVGRRNGPYDPKARCVRVNPVGQSKTIMVRIIDKCCGGSLADPNSHQLDLSQQAFQQLAPLGQGNVAIQWQLVDCPDNLQVKNDSYVCNDDYYYNR
jgi:hypothetical protein